MKIKDLRCKFCKLDNLVLFSDKKSGHAYIYHYSLDYELGCKQRISLLQAKDYLELK